MLGKKGTTVVVSMHTVRRTRFTLSRAYESCLACQHFNSNLISFVNLLTIFCFSMRMPIDTCWNIYKETSKTILNSNYGRINPLYQVFILSCFAFIATPALPTCFALRHLHETSTQRARKYYPQENRYFPKITLEGFVFLALSSLERAHLANMASVFNFLECGQMRLLKTKFPQNLRPILYVELNSDEFNSHQLKKKKIRSWHKSCTWDGL